MDSVMLADPIIIIGFIVSFALCVFALVKRAHFAVTAVAAVLFALTLTYALTKGVDLYEAGAAASVFLILHLLPRGKEGGDG